MHTNLIGKTGKRNKKSLIQQYKEELEIMSSCRHAETTTTTRTTKTKKSETHRTAEKTNDC